MEFTSGRVPGRTSEPASDRVRSFIYARKAKDGRSAEGMR